MCRLFGQISKEEWSAYDGLVEKEYSLIRQSNCNPKALQKDGWGVGYEKASRRPEKSADQEPHWEIIKSAKAPFEDKTEFIKAAEKIRSRIVIAHIRKASNPKNLPHEELVHLESVQPFSHGPILFAHNGTLNIPDETADALGDYKKEVKGKNDSEVLFWLLIKTASESGPAPNGSFWPRVFAKTVEKIERVWAELPAARKKFSAPFQGLNCVVSDGAALAALCFYDSAQGKSLCGQNRSYFEMCYNIDKEKVAVASEPMDAKSAWEPIPNRHVLTAYPDGSTELKKLAAG